MLLVILYQITEYIFFSKLLVSCITYFSLPYLDLSKCLYRKQCVLPIMKDTEYCMGIRAHIKPILGVYTASARPRIKPPPTHVAAGKHAHTQKNKTVEGRI